MTEVFAILSDHFCLGSWVSTAIPIIQSSSRSGAKTFDTFLMNACAMVILPVVDTAFKRSSIFPRVPPTDASKNEAYKNRMPPANHHGKSHDIPNKWNRIEVGAKMMSESITMATNLRSQCS